MGVLYQTSATAVGDGREGSVRSADGVLDVKLAAPTALGGGGGAATNPEQLFAAGYAACFHSAIRWIAQQREIAVDDSAVTAEVGLTAASDGLALTAALRVRLPGVPTGTARDLVEQAHRTCPYSAAIRGNVDVALHVE
ncbi:Ohr family peroxiredoxin [Saccharopolyspora sp. 5N708]|uniref:Ohr family peroxiredoxin n=1 Tax=Saccharopolyspora sp. 5N708 TaxID=3457424 RepID=UPI003FD34114